MPRTRATRQHLEEEGEQTSPLIALEAKPRTRRGTAKKKTADSISASKKGDAPKIPVKSKDKSDATGSVTNKKGDDEGTSTGRKKAETSGSSEAGSKKMNVTGNDLPKPSRNHETSDATSKKKETATRTNGTEQTGNNETMRAGAAAVATTGALTKNDNNLSEASKKPVKSDAISKLNAKDDGKPHKSTKESGITRIGSEIFTTSTTSAKKDVGDTKKSKKTVDAHAEPKEPIRSQDTVSPSKGVATSVPRPIVSKPNPPSKNQTQPVTKDATTDPVEDEQEPQSQAQPQPADTQATQKFALGTSSRRVPNRSLDAFSSLSSPIHSPNVLDLTPCSEAMKRRHSRLDGWRKQKAQEKVVMVFHIENPASALQRERVLEGRYRISKIPFFNFLTSLNEADKELINVAEMSADDSASGGSASQFNDEEEAFQPLQRHGEKRKYEPFHSELPSYHSSKRRRVDQRSAINGSSGGIVSTEPLSTSRAQNEKSPIKAKRYATTGGYDRHGNLVFPGQELQDSPPEANNSGKPHASAQIAAARTNGNGFQRLDAVKHSRKSHRSDAAPATPANKRIQSRLPKSAGAITKGPAVAVNTPLTQKVPRRWGFANTVTSSLGKIIPFNLFGRSSEPVIVDATQENDMVLNSPSDPEDSTPKSSNPIISDQIMKISSDSDHDERDDQDDLEAQDEQDDQDDQDAQGDHDDRVDQDDITRQMLSVLSAKCPDIANMTTASTLQSALALSETKHRIEAGHLQGLKDPQTQKLVTLLKRKYPDLSIMEIYTKLESVIEQHKMLSSQATRKRRRSNEVIPNPKGKSYGMDLDYFVDSSSDDEESNDKADAEPSKLHSHPRPAKRTRLDAASERLAQNQQSSRTGPTPGLRHDRRGPTPYTGNLFRSSEVAPFNVFDVDSTDPNALDQGPSSPGKFIVPYLSESEDSDVEDESVPLANSTMSSELFASGKSVKMTGQITGLANHGVEPKSVAPSLNAGAADSPGAPHASATPLAANPFLDSAAASEPPPAPTPSHAALPSTSAPMSSATPSNHDPVALARAQANKYAPKTSSKLKSVSRLSNSSIARDAEAEKDATPGQVPITLMDPLTLDLSTALGAAAAGPWPRIVLENPMENFEIDPVVSEYLAAMESL